MPPKKTEKSVAAELKKKNTEEATNIVETLKRSSQRDKTSSSKSRSHASLMENLFDSAKKVKTNETAEALTLDVADKTANVVTLDVADKTANAVTLDVASTVEEPPKKVRKTATQSKGKSIAKAEDTASKVKSRNETIVSSKTANYGQSFDSTGAHTVGNSEHGDSIAAKSKASNKADSSKAYGKKSTSRDGETSSKGGRDKEKSETGHGTASSNTGHRTAQSKTYHGSKGSKDGNRNGQSKTGHGTGYQFEIDCSAVSATIDVTELQRYLEAELMVDGKKNNLGNTMKVSCKGQIVVVTSEVYLPKKALRHLSIKFLKKNWNIRVVAKNIHSYAFKYIGHV